jgi:hypothetical protein
MNQTNRPSGRVQFSPGLLWASAAILVALIIIQAGRMGVEPARADVVSTIEGTTALTFEAQSEDLLATVDGRQEMLFVYRVQNKNSLELIRSYSLPDLFAEAKGRVSGGGRQR